MKKDLIHAQNDINKAWSFNSMACFSLNKAKEFEMEKECIKRNLSLHEDAKKLEDKTKLKHGSDKFLNELERS